MTKSLFRGERPPPPPKIKVNKAKCDKCGDIIESKHRHDFVSCSCGNIMVDGGKVYLKRAGTGKDYTELSEYK